MYAVGRLIPSGEEHFSTVVGHAINTIEEALDRYKLDEICAGFNGGKDCTALLHMYYAVVRR